MSEGLQKTNRKKIALLLTSTTSPGQQSYLDSLTVALGDECEFVPLSLLTNAPLKSFKIIKDQLERDGIGVISTQGVRGDLMGFALKKTMGKLHWITTLEGTPRRPPHRGLKAQIHRTILKSASAVIFGSEFEKHQWQGSFAPHQVHLIHPGIGMGKRLPPEVRKGTLKRLVFIGPLEPPHGCEDLIKAFSLIKPTHHDVRLEMHGSGSQIFHLTRLIERFHLSEQVRLLPVPSDIESVFTTSNVIYIHPCYHEGLSFGLQSAMNHRAPIIAYDHEAIREFFKDDESALLTRTGDVFKLSVAIAKILADKGLQKKLGENACQMAQTRFAFDQTVARYRVLYRMV